MSSNGKSFKYTVSNKGLTNEQRQFYEDNGYIVFSKLIDERQLDLYSQRFVDICNGKVDSNGIMMMKDLSLMKSGRAKGEYLFYKITDFCYDETFFEYISDEKILKIVSSIIGDDITAVNSMLINKPPDSHENTSKHPLHQDLHYFPFRPANKICASWTAMENINRENGCLFIIPGSHKGELYKHDYPDMDNNKAFYGVSGFDNHPKVDFIMEKGDTVFFHPLILHGSYPNVTKGFRKAISAHYANSNCYFIDVRGTTQQIAVDEIENIMKKKGVSASFEDMWRFKSRLVTGYPGKYQEIDSKL